MYQEMYTHLFNAMTDALEALAAHNYGQAETLLRQAQLWAEERYLEQEEAEASGLFEAQALPPAGNPPPFSLVLTKENGRGRSKENRWDGQASCLPVGRGACESVRRTSMTPSSLRRAAPSKNCVPA